MKNPGEVATILLGPYMILLSRLPYPSRKRHFGGGSGGSGGSASTAAKTEQLGYHDQDPKEALVPQAREVENGLDPRVTWRSLLRFYL